jgi:hypothetical protein
MSWLLRGCLKRNRAGAILSLEVMNGRQIMKTQILIASFATVAIGAWIGGDYFGTPYLAPRGLCVADIKQYGKCLPPVYCSYAGIQGRRHVKQDSRSCSLVTFFSWDHTVPEPVVFPERTPEQIERSRQEMLLHPRELGPAPALFPRDMPSGK